MFDILSCSGVCQDRGYHKFRRATISEQKDGGLDGRWRVWFASDRNGASWHLLKQALSTEEHPAHFDRQTLQCPKLRAALEAFVLVQRPSVRHLRIEHHLQLLSALEVLLLRTVVLHHFQHVLSKGWQRGEAALHRRIVSLFHRVWVGPWGVALLFSSDKNSYSISNSQHNFDAGKWPKRRSGKQNSNGLVRYFWWSKGESEDVLFDVRLCSRQYSRVHRAQTELLLVSAAFHVDWSAGPVDHQFAGESSLHSNSKKMVEGGWK